MRTGRGLGVILNTKDRNGIAAQALHRAVIQVDMRNLCIRRQRLRVNREPMVLRRDRNLPGEQILDRLVAATMAELQLERLSAQSVGQNLMAQTNPEDGFFPK